MTVWGYSHAALGAGFVDMVRGEELEWQVKGLCRSMDAELFFPEGPAMTHQENETAKLCRHCPILRECRDWGLNRHEEFGVWGGLTSRERRAIWKKQNNRLAQ